MNQPIFPLDSAPQDCAIAVVGGGLSGSLLVMQLIEHLAKQPASTAPPPRIVLFDRDGAFGAGVPYGELHTEPNFLLIEPASMSTPPQFQQWLLEHREKLCAEMLADGDAALAAWARANERRLADGKLDDLFAPRRVFGRFVREQLAAQVAKAAREHLADVRFVRGEVTDVRAAPEGGFSVVLDQRACAARSVVIAMGCIPRDLPASPGADDGYVHDMRVTGFGGLARTLGARVAQLGRKADVLLVGSGATASEVIYFIANSPPVRRDIRSLRVLSRSGFLAGGGLGAAPGKDDVPPGAAGRPSAREYIEASRELAACGMLSAVAGSVDSLPQVLPDQRLRLAGINDGVAAQFDADLIVNCTGSGEMTQTSSALLRNMTSAGRPFRINDLNAGFVTHGAAKETEGVDGCFIIGPLLNHIDIATHVESIHGVYRAVPPLAAELHARLVGLTSSARTSTALARD